MATALSQAQIDAIAAKGREMLRQERAAKAPEVVNLEHALRLTEPIPMFWDGREYRVKVLSYADGVRLQLAAIELDRWPKHTGPLTEEQITERGRFIEGTLALFHSFLETPPATNPFADASPWEVGELLSFFSLCLTMQGGRSRLRQPPKSAPLNTMH